VTDLMPLAGDCFVGKSFQTIDYTGTDNQTAAMKNTQKHK